MTTKCGIWSSSCLLDGVGLSLVNNKPDEVAYITLSRYVMKSLANSSVYTLKKQNNNNYFQISCININITKENIARLLLASFAASFPLPVQAPRMFKCGD